MSGTDIPRYRVRGVADLTNQHLPVPQLCIAQPVDHPSLGRLELVGQAVTLSRTPSRLNTASPDPGEHTDALLHEQRRTM